MRKTVADHELVKRLEQLNCDSQLLAESLRQVVNQPFTVRHKIRTLKDITSVMEALTKLSEKISSLPTEEG